MVCCWVLAAGGGLHAEPTPAEQARARYEEGLEAKRAHRFEEAGGHFDVAFELDPHPTLLWNAARAWELAERPHRARARYERYLELDAVPEASREEAQRRLLAVRQDIAGRAARCGRASGRALGTVAWELPAALPPPPPPPPDLETPGLALTGAGAGVLVGAVVLLSLSAVDYLDAVETSDAGAFDYIEPRRRRTEIAGWTLAGVGVAALASGIALLVLDESGRPPVVLGPVASEGGGGAAVWGRF